MLESWVGSASNTWLRILGADDAVGGFFAINGDAFDGPHGDVWYLAPVTLAWETCGMGYADRGEPIARRSRRPVPIEELWGLHAVELPRQRAGR